MLISARLCRGQQMVASHDEIINDLAVPSVFANATQFLFNITSSVNFGLLSGYSWPDALANVSAMGSRRDGRLYRLVFVGRHGEGVHNVAEHKYGTEAWDKVWSKLNGDGDLTWGPDANLTANGRNQVKQLQKKWSAALDAGLSFPAVRYTSPLSRAIETAAITYDGLGDRALHVVEDLRETIGVHTCDARSDRVVLERRFPQAIFERDFSDHDTAWMPDNRETDEHTRLRARKVIERIMAHECLTWTNTIRTDQGHVIMDQEIDSRVISITSHSGFLRNLFMELQLGELKMGTAGMVGIVLGVDCAVRPLLVQPVDPVGT